MKGNCPLTVKLGLDTLFTLVILFGFEDGFAEFVKLDQGDKGRVLILPIKLNLL